MIVVGAGLSGGSCALTILESGKRVILVEKEKKLGGNSVRASSGYNASETHYQSEQHVPDTNDIFMHDTAYSSTKDINAVATPLIETLVKNSASGIDWMESHGIKLPVISQCGGHSQARTHRPTTGAAGTHIIIMKKTNNPVRICDCIFRWLHHARIIAKCEEICQKGSSQNYQKGQNDGID